jgi:hypothetical protein
MNVYDFKGKGVAMSMYNTDEVRLCYCWLSHPLNCGILVHHWLCTFIIQNGAGEEDAPRM